MRLGAALVGRRGRRRGARARRSALFFPALGLRTGRRRRASSSALLASPCCPRSSSLFPDEDQRARGRLASAVVPGVAVVLAVACAAVGLSVDRFDAAHPVPSQLAYALDRDTGPGVVGQHRDAPRARTRRSTSTAAARCRSTSPTWPARSWRIGPASRRTCPAPQVTTLSDEVVGGKRQITVRVTPQRSGVRLVALDLGVDGGTVTRAQLAGRAVPDEALGGESLRITFHAPPADGLQASFTIEGDGPVDLRVTDGSDGLSGLPGYQPRPAGVDAAGTHSSDLVLVSAPRTWARCAVRGAVDVDDGAAGETGPRRGQPEHGGRLPSPGGRSGRRATAARRRPRRAVEHLAGLLGLHEPGATQVTEMPCGASASAIDWAKRSARPWRPRRRGCPARRGRRPGWRR